MRRFLLAVVVATFAGCDCSGGPPVGVCNGTWAGRSYADAGLDESSRLVIEYTQVCTLPDLKRYELSWGGGNLGLDFSMRTGAPTSLFPVEYTLPPPSNFETYALTPDVDGGTGTLRLTILGLRGRRGGTLELTAGAEQLSCVFEVPYTRGGVKVCASSGSGDGD